MLLLQATILAALVVAAEWLAPQSVWVTLAGGSIALTANLVFGILASIGRLSAGAVLMALMVAEAGKLLVVALGFALIFRKFPERLDGVNALLLLGAFVLTLSAQWLAPLVFRTEPRR
jgi:F0F1-type ATP synthase assembly protein I